MAQVGNRQAVRIAILLSSLPTGVKARALRKAGMNAAAAVAVLAAAPAFAATLSCPQSQRLEALVDCISAQMPQDGSEGYVAPTQAQQADLQHVAAQMLQGQCDFALPPGLLPTMAIRSFVDAANQRHYCVLMEVSSTLRSGTVDRGWGTFITYPQATRELSHQAPHPKHNTSTSGSAGDSYTEAEAIRIFKQTDARSFLMAGSRRSANRAHSSCQTSEAQADVAHNTDNIFFAVTQTLDQHYGHKHWAAMQWHGKNPSSCDNDMFISQGLSTRAKSGAKILQLQARAKLAVPDWKIRTPGHGSCDLAATTNVEGRLLNGVAPSMVCVKAARSATEKFIHIEQSVDIVGADLDKAAASWAKAVNEVYPAQP